MKNFQKFGFKESQILFFLTNNTADVSPLVFAGLCLNCQISSLPTCCSQMEYEYYLNIAKPDFVFCDLKFYSTLKECLTKLKINAKIFTFDGQTDESIPMGIFFQKLDEDWIFEWVLKFFGALNFSSLNWVKSLNSTPCFFCFFWKIKF